MALMQGQREIALDEAIVRKALQGPYRIGFDEKIVGARMVDGTPLVFVFLVEKIDETA